MLITILVLTLLTPAGTMPAATLTAPAEITIDSDTIVLGALIPFPAADPRSSVSLGYAPNPGSARRIPQYEIINKLSAAGLTTNDLQLPEAILVHRKASALDQDQVSRAVLAAFMKKFSNANVEITGIEVPPTQIGTGSVEIQASLPARFDPSTPVFVRVDVRGASFFKTVFVRTHVRIEAEQPVLKNKVAANSEVQLADIERKLSPVRGDVLDQIEGLLAKRDLERGQVLTSDLFYTPLYVRKGDSVTVKATSGGVTIAATMRAKASGKLGETIPVEHMSGAGSTTARIVGPRILETLR